MSSPDGQPEVTVASTTSLRSGGRRAAPDFAEVGSSALATPLRSGCTKAAARPVGEPPRVFRRPDYVTPASSAEVC
jgi:hypothetical protein